MFPVLSGVKDITPAKFQLDRFITVGGVDGQTNKHTHINYSKITTEVEFLCSKMVFKMLYDALKCSENALRCIKN